MGAAAVVGLAMLCLLAALAPAATAATGSISGTVTDAATSEPVEGAEVCTWSIDEEEFGGCDETGSDGTYALPGLAADEYEVEFWAGGYASQFYDGKSNWWEADPVAVGTGVTTGIDAALVAVGGVEGTITRSADGEPVEEVEACAWEAGSEDFAGCGWSDSEGEYRIELDPGEYKVEFWSGETGQNLAYQVYDRRDRWSEADVVTVAAGEMTEGVDAVLDPGATISGRVTSAATGAPLEEIPVCSIDAPSGALWSCDWTDWNGDYSLPYLPKGQYKVVFSIDFQEWFGEEFFEEENDGYSTEFWNNQITLAGANVISLAKGQSVGGIDAQLGAPPAPLPPAPLPPAPLPPAPPAPLVTPPTAPSSGVTPGPKRKRCKKGFRKKKVKGKVRCVKKGKKRKKNRNRRGKKKAAAKRVQLSLPSDHSQVALRRLLR